MGQIQERRARVDIAVVIVIGMEALGRGREPEPSERYRRQRPAHQLIAARAWIQEGQREDQLYQQCLDEWIWCGVNGKRRWPRQHGDKFLFHEFDWQWTSIGTRQT